MDREEQTLKYHFRPQRGLFGDPMPIFWKGNYHVFFQNSPKDLSFEGMSWAHIMSNDLVHWQELPLALQPEPGTPDAYGCWTGCVLEHDGVFHAFYTGCEQPGGHRQTICHATSSDLVHWEKDPDNPLLLPQRPYATYEIEGTRVAWRDPHVFQEHDGSFTMLLAADMPGAPPPFRACIGQLTSRDLKHWEPLPPLHYPKNAHKCECPDLFELDRERILLYSDYGPQVRVFDRPTEAFYIGSTPKFDDFRYYAAKTTSDDQGRRLCFAFMFNREQPRDQDPWQWGGIMAVPRELNFSQNQGLLISPVDELSQLRKGPLPINPGSLRSVFGEWQIENDRLDGRRHSGDELALALVGSHPQAAEFQGTLDMSSNGNAGFLFGCTGGLEQGYRIEVDLKSRLATLHRLSTAKNTHDPVLQQVVLPPDLDPSASLRVFLDGTAVEVFIGERACLSGRIYDVGGEERFWGFSTRAEQLGVSQVVAWELDSL